MDAFKDPQELAQACARDAHEENFSSRRGAYYLEDADVVVLYDNNPTDSRARALDHFQQELSWRGLSILGQATWPEDGYTLALLLNATRPDVDRIAELWTHALVEGPDRP